MRRYKAKGRLLTFCRFVTVDVYPPTAVRAVVYRRRRRCEYTHTYTRRYTLHYHNSSKIRF